MLNKIKKDLPQAPYFTFVWAEDNNQLIGNQGGLPWNLPSELKYFKEVTTGGVVIMGRKSYESIPDPPLPHRINIILTRNESFEAEGSLIFHNKEDILAYLEDEKIEKPIHVIGGYALFEMFMDEVDVLYRTIVDGEFEGDVYMPEIDYSKFTCIASQAGIVDEENKYPHQYYVYKRVDEIDAL